MTIKPFWVSFYQPVTVHKDFEYHGPWWISGETGDGENFTICAAVMAKDEDDAQRIIRDAYDVQPGSMVWRFTEERAKDWVPFMDRFPKADWMQWPWPGPDGKPRP